MVKNFCAKCGSTDHVQEITDPQGNHWQCRYCWWGVRSDSAVAILTRICRHAEHEWERGRSMAPRYGEIAVGSEGIRAEALCDALRLFVREIGNGATPVDARNLASTRMNEWADNWNRKRKRDFQVHIPHGTIEPLLDDYVRAIVVVERQAKFAKAWKMAKFIDRILRL